MKKLFLLLNRLTRYAWIPLIAIALLNFIRGFIHAFAPEGGARSIAHLDLSTNTQNIIFLIATIGVRQIAIGLFQLLIAFKARHLIMYAFLIDLVLLLLPRLFDKPPASVFPGMIAHHVELTIVVVVLGSFAIVQMNRRKK